MPSQKRWALLEHSGLPGGIHFDLLLEDGNVCRTWRLPNLLILDGPNQQVVSLPPHKLDWLETLGRPVSGNRGVATRKQFGCFVGKLPTSEDGLIEIQLHSEEMIGLLLIKNLVCSFSSISDAVAKK